MPSAGTVRFDKAATGRAILIPIERVYQPDAKLAGTDRHDDGDER